MRLSPLTFLCLLLSACASLHANPVVLPILGTSVVAVGRTAKISLEAGVEARLPSLEACLATVAVADLLPVGGHVIASEGTHYPPTRTSVASCLERFDALRLDADLAEGVGLEVDLLLEDVKPLVAALSRRCEVRVRWVGLLDWLDGVAPAALQLGSTHTDALVPGVDVDLALCGLRGRAPDTLDDVVLEDELVARLDRSVSRARRRLVLAGVRPRPSLPPDLLGLVE